MEFLGSPGLQYSVLQRNSFNMSRSMRGRKRKTARLSSNQTVFSGCGGTQHRFPTIIWRAPKSSCKDDTVTVNCIRISGASTISAVISTIVTFVEHGLIMRLQVNNPILYSSIFDNCQVTVKMNVPRRHSCWQSCGNRAIL